jgi:hypothetical protein
MTFSRNVRISEEDVKFDSREMNDFIASTCFMAPENATLCPESQAGKVMLMQKCYVETRIFFLP